VTRIDFYSNAPSKLSYACRLARKAYAAGSRLVIFSADNALLTSLDESLWTFSALDFLPHCRAGDPLAAETPIILASNSSGLPHHQVLIQPLRSRARNRRHRRRRYRCRPQTLEVL